MALGRTFREKYKRNLFLVQIKEGHKSSNIKRCSSGSAALSVNDRQNRTSTKASAHDSGHSEQHQERGYLKEDADHSGVHQTHGAGSKPKARSESHIS
jgi:hypothetical protein